MSNPYSINIVLIYRTEIERDKVFFNKIYGNCPLFGRLEGHTTEIAKSKKRERMHEVQRSLMKPQRATSPYVTTFNESNGGYGSTYYHSAHAHLHSPITFRNTPRQKPKPKKGPYEI